MNNNQTLYCGPVSACVSIFSQNKVIVQLEMKQRTMFPIPPSLCEMKN